MSGPLDGVKVIEFTEIIAGPLAGMLLADLGAEVIKVEPPWGEPWRFVQAFLPTESRPFMAYNRGKRSLPLDLTTPEAREIIGRLLPATDVVLVNYRPDVVTKLGLEYETLATTHPRLIYCDLTAYGRQGPDAHRPGYDIVLQAVTGMMSAEGKLDQGTPQQIWSAPLIDTTSGFCLAWSVCAALYARERTGRGQRVESTLLGSALSLLGMRFLQVESIDRESRSLTLDELRAMRAASIPFQDLLSAYQAEHQPPSGSIYYRAYIAQDGALAVGCLSDPLRRRLLDVLGLTDIRFEPGYDPTTPEALTFDRELAQQAEKVFQGNSVDHWLEILEDKGIPAGPVRFVEELVDDPQVLANGLPIEVAHRDAGTIKMVGPLAQFSDSSPPVLTASPALGEHTLEILSELGYSPEDVERWRSAGIVG